MKKQIKLSHIDLNCSLKACENNVKINKAIVILNRILAFLTPGTNYHSTNTSTE